MALLTMLLMEEKMRHLKGMQEEQEERVHTSRENDIKKAG